MESFKQLSSPSEAKPSMECPVCDRVFPLAVINVHVNKCLGSNQDVMQAEAEDRSTNTSNVPAKRQKTSSWGSLQPLRSSNLSGSLSCSASVSASAAKKPKQNFAAARKSRTAGSRVELEVEEESETSGGERNTNSVETRSPSGDGKERTTVMNAVHCCCCCRFSCLLRCVLFRC